MDFSGKDLTSLDQVPRFAQSVDLSHNKLQSLRSGATHSHSPSLHNVEELFVSHNRISALVGVGAFVSLKHLDCSSNSLRRIDVAVAGELAELAFLHTLDLSDNNIGAVHLDKIAATASSLPRAEGNAKDGSDRVSARPRPPFTFLTRVILSNNLLASIPDLTMCPALQELRLDHNELASLRDIHALLPPRLVTLALHNNQIDSWFALSELTSFADTLVNISLSGNPFVSQVRFSVKLYVAWLLPVALYIDDQQLDAQEQAVVEGLFRRSAAANFAEDLLQLMDDGREAELEEYLEAHCVVRAVPAHHGGGGRHHGSSSSDADSRAQRHRQGDALIDQLRCSTGSTRENQLGRGGGGEMDSLQGSSNLVGAVESLSIKLRNVTEVVKVLRRQDINRRVRAAIVIQKFVRGYQTRRRLPHAARHRLKLAHRAVLVARSRGPSGVVASDAQELREMRRELSSLSAVLQRTWSDIGQIKAFVHTQRVHAAKVIQSFYRGYKARLRFRRVRAEFRRFAAKFVPAVVKIQSVARMFLQRKRFLRLRDKEREARALREDVVALKAQVSQLFDLVRSVMAHQQQHFVPSEVASSLPARRGAEGPHSVAAHSSNARSGASGQQPEQATGQAASWREVGFRPDDASPSSPSPRIASWAPTGSRHELEQLRARNEEVRAGEGASSATAAVAARTMGRGNAASRAEGTNSGATAAPLAAVRANAAALASAPTGHSEASAAVEPQRTGDDSFALDDDDDDDDDDGECSRGVVYNSDFEDEANS